MTVESARKISATILRSFADSGQRPISEATDISESRLSRWKSGDQMGGGLHMDEVARVLDALGLAVIDANAGELVTLSKDEHQALTVLARKALLKVAA